MLTPSTTCLALVHLVLATGCFAAEVRQEVPADAAADARVRPDAIDYPDAAPPCVPPSPPGPEAMLAPEFAGAYTYYDLGPVPGVPSPLGGATIQAGDPNTLLIAGGSERDTGAIYRIGVERDACGHIVGFVGTATRLATAPFVDANLVYLTPELLLYTQWPVFGLSQQLAGGTQAAVQTDLRRFPGMIEEPDRGPGGLGLVPPGLAAAGELRMVSWPEGHWYHLAVQPSDDIVLPTGVTATARVPNNPGGFAYVPAGSPGFTVQSIIVAEWVAGTLERDRVVVYEADPQGDPIIATRKEFFTRFPRPWGAYFEPLTGDFLFLSFGQGTDRVYVVQGFVPPPPIE